MKYYIKTNIIKFILSIILMFLVSLGTIYSIYMRSEAVSFLMAGDEKVYQVVFLMLGIVIASELIKVVLSLNNASLLRAWKLMLGKKIINNISTMGYDYFHKNELGSYISWYTGDLPLVSAYIFENMLSIANHISLAIIALIILYVISWKIVLFSIVLLLILFFFGTRFGKVIGAAYQKYGILNGIFNHTLQEYLGGYDLLKNFNRLNLAKEKISNSHTTLENQMYTIKNTQHFRLWDLREVRKYLKD